ncbi:MAG TPA: hypothetical protein VGK46_03890 [Saprospiraceae bacterium]
MYEAIVFTLHASSQCALSRFSLSWVSFAASVRPVSLPELEADGGPSGLNAVPGVILRVAMS